MFAHAVAAALAGDGAVEEHFDDSRIRKLRGNHQAYDEEGPTSLIKHIKWIILYLGLLYRNSLA